MKRLVVLVVLLGLVAVGVAPAAAGDQLWTASAGGLLSTSSTIASAAFSPAYATDHTLFAGSEYGGLYRSKDGGASWQRVFSAAPRAIRAIAFSPGYAADHTLFAGAEFLGSYNNGGVWKSSDGGDTWTRLTPDNYWGGYAFGVEALAVSPGYAADRTLWAASSVSTLEGVWKSSDGGANWTLFKLQGSYGPTPLSLAVSPDYAQDQTVFAGCSGGIYKSSDGGQTWRKTSSHAGEFLDVSDIAVSPAYAADRTVFAALQAIGDAWGVLKSGDGGETWQWANNGLPPAASSEAPDVGSLAVSPNYAADHTLFTDPFGQGVWRSTDGGASWQAANGGAAALKVHPGALAISPDYAASGSLLAGGWFSQGRLSPGMGLWKTASGGLDWAALALPDLWVESIAVSPDFAQDHTALLTDNRGQGWQSGDGGLNWVRQVGTLGTLDLYGLAFSPNYAADGVQFARTAAGLYRSTDRGASWNPTTLAGGQVVDLAFSPNYAADRTLWAGVYGQGAWMSNDGGLAWSSTFFTQTAEAHTAFSPGYAADRTLLVAAGYDIYRSTDGGQGWQLLYHTDSKVTRLALSPEFPAAADPSIPVIFWTQADFKFCYWNGYGGACTYLNDQAGLPTFLAYDLAFSPGFARDRTLLVGGITGVQKITLSEQGVQAVPMNAGGLEGYEAMALAFTPGKPLAALAGLREGGVWQYGFDKSMQVKPASLTLAARPGERAMPVQLQVTSAAPLSVSTHISPTVSWLTVTPGGAGGMTFTLAADANSLPAGVYHATLVLEAEGEVAGSPALVPVEFIVGDMRQLCLPVVRR